MRSYMSIFRAIQSRAISCTVVMAMFVAGCVPRPEPVQPPPVEVVQVAQNEVTDVEQNDSVPVAITALIQELSEEVRSLRNQVEMLDGELRESQRRQKVLYDDLDARLRKFERTVIPVERVAEETEGITPDVEVAPDEAGITVESTETMGALEEVTVEQEPAINPEVIREIYDNAFRTLKDGKYEDAIVEFSALVQTYPNSDLVDDALYWIAEANYVTKEFAVALKGFEQIIIDYPNNRRAAEAMLKIGYIYYDQQDYQQAENYLRELIDRYPASRSAFSAGRRLNKMKRDGNL